MGKALNLLEKLNRIQRLHENDDDVPYLNVPREDEMETENSEQEVEGKDAEDELEDKINQVLSDLGLVSSEVVEEEDGDVYIDLAFEDKTSLSLQMFVDDEGQAKLALLSDEEQTDVPEIILPDSFVDEEGKLLIDMENFPDEEVKNLVKEKVNVTNTTEVYRRSRKTNESLSMTRMKKRLTKKSKRK